MGQRIIISESERKEILSSHNSNGYVSSISETQITKGLQFLFESSDHVEKLKQRLEDTVSDNFDQDSEKFVDNIIADVPKLKKDENFLKSEVGNIMKSTTNKIIAISLVSLIILTLVVRQFKPDVEKEKIENVIVSNGLENFYKEFKKNNPDATINSAMQEDAAEKLSKEFIPYVNRGYLNDTPLILKSTMKIDDEALLIFGRGVDLFTEDTIHASFVGIVPFEMAKKLNEDSSYFVNMTIKKVMDDGVFDYKGYEVTLSPYNVWSFVPKVEMKDTEDVLDDEKKFDIGLGTFMVDITGITPAK